MKPTLIKTAFLLVLLLFSCTFFDKKNDKNEDSEAPTLPYFEGVIKLSESRGLYGSLFKVHTTYHISENRMKREQELGGVNALFSIYAGMVIDLQKDSIVLYYADGLAGTKNKHTLNIGEYKKHISNDYIPQSVPAPYDNTFKLLPEYVKNGFVKDSTAIKGFMCDYALYKDSLKILKQEVFDTKVIHIKRPLVELTFLNIPAEINFPLKSEVHTTISDISNDSIIAGKQTKLLDELARRTLNGHDSITVNEKSDLEKLSENKWLKIGLDLVKKGVDLNINIESVITEVTKKVLKNDKLSLPSGDFTEIEDFDEFMNSMPSAGGGDDFD